MDPKARFNTVDEYIASLPPVSKRIVKELRKTIRAAAPGAEEKISYNMPSMKFHGMLVYYAAWKEHIGFYPFTSAIKAFKKELTGYEGAKGSVRFKLDEPVPFELVERIIKFRMQENLKAHEEKLRKKKTKTIKTKSKKS